MKHADINTVYFVVLHYGPIERTIRCVDSLLTQEKVSGVHCCIVIVENGYSPARDDGLSHKYSECEGVVLIKSVENLGFSGGNNLGYDYIERQSVDGCVGTIAVFLNNDTEISDPAFMAKLVAEYETTHFDVLSPDVFDPSVQQHQSPLCKGSDIDTYARGEALKARALVDEQTLARIYHALKNRVVACFGITAIGRRLIRLRRIGTTPSTDWEQPLEDVVPQGSAVIFGPSYLDKSTVAFEPQTFMYFEECILKKKCESLGLSIRYLPTLQVLHHHNEITLESLFANTYEKRRKQARLTVEAYRGYLDYL